MKNIALIAGLSLAISTTALADNNVKITAPELVYVATPQTKVTGPDLTTWGWSYYYDIKSKDSAIVITKPIFLATNLVGVKGLNMSVEGFAGIGLETGRPLAGVAGLFKGKVADQIWIGVGPGVTAQDGKPLGFGVLGQVSVKF